MVFHLGSFGKNAFFSHGYLPSARQEINNLFFLKMPWIALGNLGLPWVTLDRLGKRSQLPWPDLGKIGNSLGQPWKKREQPWVGLGILKTQF
jgi:hypothetical protein